MKMKTLVAAAVASFLATSFAYAAPIMKLVDDTNSTTMQQMSTDDASTVAGPMADASKNLGGNVGATPPSTAQPAAPDNSMNPSANNMDPQSPMAMNNTNNMDPQTAAPSTADGDMSADTTTGDDDY